MNRLFTSSIEAAAFLPLAVAVCASWPAAAWGELVTVARTTADPGGADARIGGIQSGGEKPDWGWDQTNVNFGGEAEVWARYASGAANRREKAYLRFRLPSDIGELETAQLSLWMRPNQNKKYQLWGLKPPAADARNGYGYNGAASMARLGADWAEHEIIWHNAPGNVESGASNDLDAAYATQLYAFGSGSVGANGASRLINDNETKTDALVNFLKSHIENGGEYVTFIVITTTTTANSGGFIAKEHENVLDPESPWHAPRLTLTYTPVKPSSRPSPGKESLTAP